MSSTFAISILASFLTAAAPGTQTVRQTLLRDGFVLWGINGKLTKQESPAPTAGEPELNRCATGWFFEFGSDVSDYRALLKAGTRLELLPSTTLEKMVADANECSGVSYRLWARVTKYKGRNFMFPVYFLPIVEATQPPPQASETQEEPQQREQSTPPEPPPVQEQKWEPAIDDPNAILKIPKEIIEKLKAKKIIRPKRLPRTPKEIKAAEEDLETQKTGEKEPKPAKRPQIKQDSILVDRTALLVKQDNGQFVFVLDALGRNVQQVSLWLLPCQALELTERRQSAVPEPVRFKIAGIITEYKGSSYLLLQKATRAYSHENFDR